MRWIVSSSLAPRFGPQAGSRAQETPRIMRAPRRLHGRTLTLARRVNSTSASSWPSAVVAHFPQVPGDGGAGTAQAALDCRPHHAPGAGHIERPLHQGEPTGQRAPQHEDEERGSVAGRERHRRRRPQAAAAGVWTPRPTANLAQELARNADASGSGTHSNCRCHLRHHGPRTLRVAVRCARSGFCRCAQTWPSPR